MATRERPEQVSLDLARSTAIADTQAEFERLAIEWKQETAHLSSP